MVRSLKVTKIHHPVELTYEGDGLRIEGDFNASKKATSARTCGCLPVPPPKRFDPTLLPIKNENILYAFFNDRTKMVQINAVLPLQDAEDAPMDLYKFMYTVDEDKEPEAIEFCQQLVADVYSGLQKEKRLKVLINPFGGQGKAKKIYEEHVKPVFESAKCTVDVQYTEHQGHAIQIAKDLDIESYDAIVTVSGDGIIHEVLNGYMQRPDARHAMRKVPLGVIPGGSGNALSICLLGEKQGFDPTHTALQVIKGKTMDMDLCSVTYEDHRYFSFLSHNYGVTSYADLATEHLRWMGDARTVVGIMQEIFSRHTYGLEAAMQVVESDKEKIKAGYRQSRTSASPASPAKLSDSKEVLDTIPALSEPVPPEWLVIKDNVSVFLTSKMPLLGRGMLSHPCAVHNDGLLDLMLIRGSPGVLKQLDVFAKVEKGTHIDLDIVEYYKIKAFRLTPKVPAGKKAFVAIDGEHAPLKPFQVEVHPRLASVLSLHTAFVPTSI